MQISEQGDFIDKRLSLFISFSFLLVAINRFATLPFLSDYQSVIALGQWGIYAYLFITNLKFIRNRSNSLFKGSYLLFVILYFGSCIYSLARGMSVDLIISHELVWTLFFFLPVGISTFAIVNYKILYETLYKVSYPISILCVFYSIYRLYINPFGNSYDMAFGYILLVPTLLHCSKFKKTRKRIILIVIIIEMVFLVWFGSRGVIIGIIAFLFLSMLLRARTRLARCKALLPILALLMCYVELPKINDYLENHNIYSRTLYKLATGDADDETHGRENHWDVGKDLILENPILGYGLGGYYYEFYNKIAVKHPDELYSFDIEERVWVKGKAGVSGAHSGFIDMMLFFGVLIGLPVAFWLLFSVFKLKIVENQPIFDLSLIFYCSFIIGNMLVGGGIFTKPGCAIFIYLMYKLKKKPSIAYDTRNN